MESDVGSDAIGRTGGMQRRTAKADTYHALSCVHAARRALNDAESYLNGTAICDNPYERARLAVALAEGNINAANEALTGLVDTEQTPGEQQPAGGIDLHPTPGEQG